MQNFKFLLYHDFGTVQISVTATCLDAAKLILMAAEGCPECALQPIV